MSLVDRTLLLKIATDTGEVNAKLDATGSKLGKVGSQVAGFAKAAAIGLALEGVDLAVQKIGKGIDDAKAYRTALLGLNLALANTGVEGTAAADAVDELNARSLALGFDDVETVQAFQRIVDLTGDVDEAMRVMEASFDRSRAEQKDLGTAVDETIRLYRGGVRQMELFGLSTDEYGKTAADGIDRVEAALGRYGTAAEDFAGSTEGMQERVGVQFDRAFATLGEEILKIADQVLPVLIDDVLPALGEAFAIVQPFLQDMVAAVGELFGAYMELWDSLEPARDALAPIVEIMGAAFILSLETVTKLITGLAQLFSGDFTGALDTFRSAATGVLDPLVDAFRSGLNVIIDLWNRIGLPAFSVPIPQWSIDTPLGQIEVFGGGSFQLWGPIGLPDIPRLARGGIVSAPTLALIGEAGPEAVVPLNSPQAAQFGGGDVILNVTGDPRVVEAAVVSALRRVGRGSVRVDPFRPTLGAR